MEQEEATSRINRIRLEFKVLRRFILVLDNFTVLIESDWNLKYWSMRPIEHHSSINRIRLEFKAVPCSSAVYIPPVLIESDWNLKLDIADYLATATITY